MTDKLKKWLYIIAIGGTIATTWGTLVTTVIYLDTLRKVIELAGSEDKYGKTGLEKYLIMELQHNTLWRIHIDKAMQR